MQQSVLLQGARLSAIEDSNNYVYVQQQPPVAVTRVTRLHRSCELYQHRLSDAMGDQFCIVSEPQSFSPSLLWPFPSTM